MWEKKPILLIVLATCAILVGTIVTMVLPFAWVNTEAANEVAIDGSEQSTATKFPPEA